MKLASMASKDRILRPLTALVEARFNVCPSSASWGWLLSPRVWEWNKRKGLSDWAIL